MNIGYILLIVLGMAWTAIAVVMSEAKRKNCQIQLFYLTGSLFAAAILWLFIGCDGMKEIFSPVKRIALLCFITGALFNAMGQTISMLNLKQGGRALAYAIPQQAFIFPYVWSIFFFNQHVSLVSAMGILLIATAIVYLALCRKQDTSSALPLRRIITACIAMLIMGTGQIFMTLPTQLETSSLLSPVAGTGVIFCTNVLFFAAWSAISQKPKKQEIKISLIYGLIWGVIALFSFYVLLQTLRVLCKIRQAGIVFPVGAGVLIVCYTAFTALCYREKLSFKQILAFCAVISGVLMSKLG